MKIEIELQAKHCTAVSALRQLTYWVWYKNDSVRNLHHRHPTDRDL